MSTRVWIAKELDNGKYRSIYCHNDGYPSHTGMVLLKGYNTEEKLDELLDVGDISVIGEQLNPDPTKPHDHLEFQNGVVLAYGRDIGEKRVGARERDYSAITTETDCNYTYIFTRNQKWTFIKLGQPTLEVKDLAEELKYEQQETVAENEEREDAETEETLTQSM